MALFLNKWGDIRGKVADLVFSANAAGAYIRSKVTPINPQTFRQMAARARLASYANDYSTTLTDAQREGWNDLAKRTPYSNIFGEKKNLNGIAMFCKINTLLNLTGFATLTTAPNNLTVRPLSVEVVTAPTTTGRDWIINVTPELNANEAILMYSTAGVQPAISFVKNLYRYSGLVSDSEENPLTMHIDDEIGSIAVGQKVHAQFCRLNILKGAITLGVPQTSTIIA